jgi:hypothetical protein
MATMEEYPERHSLDCAAGLGDISPGTPVLGSDGYHSARDFRCDDGHDGGGDRDEDVGEEHPKCRRALRLTRGWHPPGLLSAV